MRDPADQNLSLQLVELVTRQADLMTRFLDSHEDRLRLTFDAREDLKELRSRLERIVRVIHEGNGQKPIITRLDLLELRQEDLLSRLERELELINERLERDEEAAKQEQSEVLRTLHERQTASINGRWLLVAALVGSAATVAVGFLGLIPHC